MSKRKADEHLIRVWKDRFDEHLENGYSANKAYEKIAAEAGFSASTARFWLSSPEYAEKVERFSGS